MIRGACGWDMRLFRGGRLRPRTMNFPDRFVCFGIIKGDAYVLFLSRCFCAGWVSSVIKKNVHTTFWIKSLL